MSVTEATIRGLASAQTFSRGEDYYHSGAVLELSKRGDTLLAQVEGSSYEAYEVTIELGEIGVVEADCTCPYDWGGCCKHIVAVLLAYIREPDQVTERQPVSDLLADLERDELLDLLTDLMSEQPRLVDWVETQLATRTAQALPEGPGQPRQRQAPIDPESFRKQAGYIMSSYEMDYWGDSGAVDEIRDLVDKAQPFVEAGDGRNALLILEAVTGPFVNHWYEVDHDGDASATLFADLGALFAEAILSADLSPEEREALAEKLSVWQAEIENYGIDEGFHAAIEAAMQGWDYPPLQAVLKEGHVTDKGVWEEEAPWYADDLAVARLNVLERQGRTTEYLYLAEAEGQTALYLTMLVKTGRAQEAVEYAMQHMATTDEALTLAQALRDHDHPLDALKIAERGLTLDGETLTLARWLRDFAAQVGRLALALLGARAAFARSYSLEDYQAAGAIAGEEWPSVKPELLDLLASADYAFGKIDIYLQEGMVDEAVQAIDRRSWGYSTVERVVDAAWESHPDWVIRQCKKQAEPIMDGGKSQHYHHAVRWLEKARRAYLAAEREDEWRAYLEGLISKHARKYSLRPQLEALREGEA